MRKSLVLLIALSAISGAAQASPDRLRVLCLSNVDGGEWDPQNLNTVKQILGFQGISEPSLTIRSAADASCDLVLALHDRPYISGDLVDGQTKEVLVQGLSGNGIGGLLFARATGLCLAKAAGSRLDISQVKKHFERENFYVRPYESVDDAVECDLIVAVDGSPSKKSAAEWEDETNAEYRAAYNAHGGGLSSINLDKSAVVYEYEADILDGPTKAPLKRMERQVDFAFFSNLKYNLSEDVLKPARAAAARAAVRRSKAASVAAAQPSDEVLQRVAEAAVRRATEEAERRHAAPPAPAQERRTKAVVSDVDQPSYRDAARPDDVALVIGIEKYNDLPDAEFAERDAVAVQKHLIALGFAPRNVLLLTGSRASRTGIATAIERKLPSMIKPGSVVFFYYSGHGAPDPETGKAYLLPADGDPQYLEDSGYALPRLYAKLGALKARRVLVALDACFSGAGGRSVLPKGMRPLVTKIDEGVVPAKVTALTASGAREISGSLSDQGHGIFTYYLLKGLSDGRRSFQALFEYVKPNVEDAARLQNHPQSPVLAGPDAAL